MSPTQNSIQPATQRSATIALQRPHPTQRRTPKPWSTLAIPTLLAVLSISSFPVGAAAQVTTALETSPSGDAKSESPDAVPLTLAEVIQIALTKAYAIRQAELDVDNASAQIREGWGQVFPQISLSSSYQRNIRSANPFSGSDAGDFFSGLGLIDWLGFNEQARTDGNPSTEPITLEDFFSRQAAGLEQAGIVRSGSDNPFAVPNQMRTGVSIDQKVFDIRTFWGISGARKYLRAINEAGLQRQQQLIVNDATKAFFAALLAEESARVIALSTDRTRTTRTETAQRVAMGTAPKFQRLTAEVELANLESDLVQGRNSAAESLDQLKQLIGIPVDQPIRLSGALEDDGTYITVGGDNAVGVAIAQRADLEQARINIDLERLQQRVEKATYVPALSVFADLAYVGNVPDQRTFTISDPTDPFRFSAGQNSFFADSYWDFTVAAGFRLSWTVFDGFQARSRAQQRRIAVDRAKIQHEQLAESIRAEVTRALRNVEAAQLRISSQRRNVEQAELNYSYASTRLKEGVASPLDERQASNLLDQAQLNYYQAMFDLLVAKSDYSTALGRVPGTTTSLALGTD